MLDAFLDGAAAAGATIERLYVRELELKGCIACGHCDRKGFCIQKDDMQKVYPVLEQATHVVVASPVYFYGVTGQLKLLVDRSQAVYMKHELAKKEGREAPAGAAGKGFLIAAGATKGKRLFECTVLSVRYFFDALNMSYAGDLCIRDLEDKGAVARHPTALEDCRKAGMEFVG
jgi:multimeric flavodoxin WrbA